MARHALVRDDGVVLSHGFCAFTAAVGESVHAVPDEFACDNRTERFDATAPTKKRTATVQELADYDAAQRATDATRAVDTNKLMRAAIRYFTKRLNELRQNPTTAYPSLTASEVRQGIVDEYTALT